MIWIMDLYSNCYKQMQLADQKLNSEWYFLFGPRQKSSLAAQYALEHGLHHLINPTPDTLKQHQHQSLIIEASAEVFRAAEKSKLQITVVFLKGDYSKEEAAIKTDYEQIGKIKYISDFSYDHFRKQLYPFLIILYGPSLPQLDALTNQYFAYIGYQILPQNISANELIKRYSKSENYVLLGLVPELQEIDILERFFHIKIIHLKHQRTEMQDLEAYFNKESQLIPLLSKKTYFHSINGQSSLDVLLRQIAQKILPELIFVNVHQEKERSELSRYAESSSGLILNIFSIQSVLKNKSEKLKASGQKLELICHIVFRNLNRKEILFTDYPFKPEQFQLFEYRTRPFKVFADCLTKDNYIFSKSLNSAIYFLETNRRKPIDVDFPFEKQLQESVKYLAVSGPTCAGKTTAAKYISSQFGYKHIEYEPYVASLKQKLIAPEDGEELPFRKVIAHFAALVKESQSVPLIIDGLAVDTKEMDNWTRVVGAPVIINLKVQQKELTRRTRKKNEADLAAQIGEEQAAKIKETISKNNGWCEEFTGKNPHSTMFQVDFSQQMILGEQLLKQILRPRVYLIQENNTLLFQNLAIINNFGFYNLRTHRVEEIVELVKKGSYRDVIICNYSSDSSELICQDFYQIEKHIGEIRYLAVWSDEDHHAHQQPLELKEPPKVQKPKLAQGEQAEPPAAEQEGENKKKAFNIYEHQWTKPGNRKNLSQWFFKEKTEAKQMSNSFGEISGSVFGEVLQLLRDRKKANVYHKVAN